MKSAQNIKKNSVDNILIFIVSVSAIWLAVEILHYLKQYNLSPLQSELSRLGNDRLNQLGVKTNPTNYLLVVIITSMILRLLWFFQIFNKKISSFLLFYIGQLLSIAISFKTRFFIDDNYLLLIIQILLLIIFCYTQKSLFDNFYSKTKQIVLFILTTLSLHLCFTNIIDLAQNLETTIENPFFSLILFILILASILSVLQIFLGDFKKIYSYIIAQVLIVILYTVYYLKSKSYYENYSEVVDKMKIDYVENIVPIVLLMIGFSLYLFKYTFRKDKESLKMIESIGK